jgi:tRNA uridine 5-carboxymethylaminomethyl modification enzyme
MKNSTFDAIVIGGGHAGSEAAASLARLGFKTLLITFNKNKIASMPCNPSIGGPAKGIVTREIDALGGLQGYVADLCKIQTRMLNQGKGASVQALRFQIDNELYPRTMANILSKIKKLTIVEETALKFIIKDNKVCGVQTNVQTYTCKVVVLATGTYMDSKILTGDQSKSSGPMGEPTSSDLSIQLKELRFPIIRLKTGTPPRIDKKSIDYSQMIPQTSDSIPHFFSQAKPEPIIKEDYPCYLTYTNLNTHQIILDNLKKSAMYGGHVTGIGPRYCPSIEDKVVRFSDKERHQVFLEPTSINSQEIYLQGLSTSMPTDVQELIIHSIKGLEKAIFIKYAYAIEYDAINPIALKSSLETKLISGLFFAGQINGTSGYEEAAGQGLIAGINAARLLQEKEPIVLSRDTAYIGVLIDDIITKGTNEPYRLLTARAEYRLILRNDNSFLRLASTGKEIGLLSDEYYTIYQEQIKNKDILYNLFKSIKISYTSYNEIASKYNIEPISQSDSLFNIIKKSQIVLEHILLLYDLSSYDVELIDHLVTEIKYEGYITKLNTTAEKLRRLEQKKIPDNINYSLIPNIASESREKLNLIKPSTIGQASRILGVNPVDINLLIIYLENHGNRN